MKHLVLVLAALTALATPAAAQAPAAQDGIAALLTRLEQALRTSDGDAYLGLLSQSADRQRAAQFASQSFPRGVTRAVVRERDRTELAGTLPGDGFELLLEVFLESGSRARLVTWRVNVRRRGGPTPAAGDEWGIAEQEAMTALTGLYRLSLNPTKEFAAKDLVINAEDFQLTLDTGTVFVAEAEGNTTALVVLGRGEMTFTPAPKVERGQVRLLTGAETLTTPFDAAFLRVNPFDLDARVNRKVLTPRPVDPRDLKRAEDIFRQDIGKSFSLDLGELSTDTWSLLPNSEDFLAEVRTRRFETLTYARSAGEIEDISLFDRKNHHNISLYASKAHIQQYGRFFSEDEQADFRVTHFDLDVDFNPTRSTIEGRARLLVETLAKSGTNTLTVRLAESLNIRSVYSSGFGRLLFVRVRNQNALVISLPSTVLAGYRMTLLIDYGGPLTPQPIDREGLWPQNPQIIDESTDMPVEPSFLFSNRAYWYPQPPIGGYSTATIRISVPENYSCVASGDPEGVAQVPAARSGGATRQFTFSAPQPARYYAFLVTRLADVRTEKVHLASAIEPVRPPRLSGVFYDDVDLVTKTNPRLRGRGRDLSKTAQDILRFYSSIVGDCPYPSLTLALVERGLPAGHSPPYLAVVSLPTPGSRLSFRDDPASFPEFPEFFLAHELAHQWWGQAVGWKNYHEQWLSEGFAQYFAAMYAERVRGKGVFDSVLRRMRRWTMDESEQGPVYLGYRIGHVKGDSRLFRAVVYNKGATVLHLLRGLLGDRAFFAGMRRFYDLWRFEKAGSDDLRQAMEAEGGVPLGRFFEQWVYGQTLPQVVFTWKVEQNGSQEALLRFEQPGEAFDVPITVTLDYADRPPATLVVKLKDKLTELRVPLAGLLRRAEIDRDESVALVK
jgi:hypothetical protein